MVTLSGRLNQYVHKIVPSENMKIIFIPMQIFILLNVKPVTLDAFSVTCILTIVVGVKGQKALFPTLIQGTCTL